ncbi:MAG: hypothetical protein Q4D57_03755 [Clostridia bacterium]|nr:hypothetical protein [Clostridia bacterium]
MNLKKLIKISLATFIISIPLNVNAIKPTSEQLESFYKPFEELLTDSAMSQYSNIKYLPGLEILEEEVGHKFFSIVNTLKPSPEDFETSEEYAAHLYSFRTNSQKIIDLDKQISQLKSFILKETTVTSPDKALLLTFYEELSAVLSTDNCNKFIEKAEAFVKKWNSTIRSTNGPIGGIPLDSTNEDFSKAREAAKENTKLFFRKK